MQWRFVWVSPKLGNFMPVANWCWQLFFSGCQFFFSLLLRSSIKKFAFEFACEKEPKIMVGRETIARSVYHIQPIWSTSHAEARTRVIKLYKSWFREIPHIGRLSIRFRFVLFGFFSCFLFKIAVFSDFQSMITTYRWPYTNAARDCTPNSINRSILTIHDRLIHWWWNINKNSKRSVSVKWTGLICWATWQMNR